MIARRALLATLAALPGLPALAQKSAPDQATLEAAFKLWGEQNKAWLAENLRLPGWKATADGLQYRRLVADPKGFAPVADGSILVRYSTRLAKAGVIDSRLGDPIELKVASLLPGMIEAVLMMRTGESWDFAVPPELGYGDKVLAEKDGRLKVPPGSALVWHVELVAAFG